MKAAEYMLERGYGKIPQPVAIAIVDSDNVQALSTEELMRIAASDPSIIEGEVIPNDDAVQAEVQVSDLAETHIDTEVPAYG